MKKKELWQISDGEMDKLFHDTHEEIGKLRLQKALGQLENAHLIRTKRRLLAQIITLQKQKAKTGPVK